MPFGLSVAELVIMLIVFVGGLALLAWLGWIAVETARRFMAELRGPASDR